MKIIIIFVLSLVMCFCSTIDSKAKKRPNNPADKYTDAYKKYENATLPIKKDNIKHFVYFARDRESLINHPFLTNKRFSGAQIMYSWAELEPEKDKYDFSKINEDYKYLKSKGKKLFIQLQDATFSENYKGVPVYLQSEEFDGGTIQQIDDNGIIEGWTAKRWNKNVQSRFALLLNALGAEFDGKIEGINLQETSIGVTNKRDSSFTPALYIESIKTNMSALKKAFPLSVKLQYANFVPGEWLPWDNKGYLKSIYMHGETIGVGLGAPDLMVTRKGQLNNPLTMMHEYNYSVPVGIAIQDGNYVGETGNYTVKNIENRKNIVPMLHAFAKDFLKVDYMFWSYETPYFEKDVLPCFISE